MERVWQNVPARPAIVSFLLAYPHLRSLSPSTLASTPLPIAFFFLVVPLLPRPTAHRRDNRKLKKLLSPIDTQRRRLIRSPAPREKKKTASFRGETAAARRSKLRMITIMRRDGLKSRTAERKEIVVNPRDSRLSEETCAESKTDEETHFYRPCDVTYFFFARHSLSACDFDTT